MNIESESVNDPLS